MGKSRVRVLCSLRVSVFQLIILNDLGTLVLNDTRSKKLSKSVSVIIKHYKNNYAVSFLLCLFRHGIFQTKKLELFTNHTIQILLNSKINTVKVKKFCYFFPPTKFSSCKYILWQSILYYSRL